MVIFSSFSFEETSVKLKILLCTLCKSLSEIISTVHDVFPGHHELHHHWPELRSLKDPLVRQLHIWCLLNARVVQENAQRQDVVLVHYHDLVLSPKQELARIVNELGWKPRDKGWEIDDYLEALDPNQSSDTDFRGERKAEATEQLWKNQAGLSQERLQALQTVLDQHRYTLPHGGHCTPQKALKGRVFSLRTGREAQECLPH